MALFDELEKVIVNKKITEVDNILRYQALYRNYISENTFMEKIQKIIEENNNIPQVQIDKFVQTMLFKPKDEDIDPEDDKYRILGRNESWFIQQAELGCKILDIITAKNLLSSDHVKQIIEIIGKRSYMPHSFLWVDNLILLKFPFGKTDLKTLKKHKYDEDLTKFLNRYDQQIDLPKETIDELFKSRYLYRIMNSQNLTRNVIKNMSNKNIVPTRQHFLTAIEGKTDSFSTLTFSSNRILKTLDYLKLCSYNFTSDDLIHLLFYEQFGYSSHITVDTRKVAQPILLASGGKSSRLYAQGVLEDLKKDNNLLTSIINFFGNIKIHLTLPLVCQAYNSRIYTNYEREARNHLLEIHCNFITMIKMLTNVELIKLTESESNVTNIIMTSNMFYQKYYDFQEKYYDFQEKHKRITDTVVNTLHAQTYNLVKFPNITNLNTVQTIVAVNDSFLLSKILDSNPMILTKINDGMKYACVNLNTTLIDFYLNQKVVPNGYHACCLILALLRSDDDVFPTKLTLVCDILEKLCLFGLKVDEKLYKVFCTVKGLDDKKLTKIVKLSSPTMAEIRKSVKIAKNIVPKCAIKVVKSQQPERQIKEATPQIIKEMFKYSSLSHILYLCDLHKYTPDAECVEFALQLNWYPNVFEYYADKLKWNATVAQAESIGHNSLKEISLYRSNNVRYTDDKKVVVEEVVVKAEPVKMPEVEIEVKPKKKTKTKVVEEVVKVDEIEEKPKKKTIKKVEMVEDAQPKKIKKTVIVQSQSQASQNKIPALVEEDLVNF